MPGTIEHTQLLSYIINYSRNKQCQIIITHLDLKNAFGEVNHDLLLQVLDYHHLVIEVKELIKNYYENYALSTGTKQYHTDAILVGKGVLQRDCLSPLLFNMVMNTLIKTIGQKKVRCTGYDFCYSLLPMY